MGRGSGIDVCSVYGLERAVSGISPVQLGRGAQMVLDQPVERLDQKLPTTAHGIDDIGVVEAKFLDGRIEGAIEDERHDEPRCAEERVMLARSLVQILVQIAQEIAARLTEAEHRGVCIGFAEKPEQCSAGPGARCHQPQGIVLGVENRAHYRQVRQLAEDLLQVVALGQRGRCVKEAQLIVGRAGAGDAHLVEEESVLEYAHEDAREQPGGADLIDEALLPDREVIGGQICRRQGVVPRPQLCDDGRGFGDSGGEISLQHTQDRSGRGQKERGVERCRRRRRGRRRARAAGHR